MKACQKWKEGDGSLTDKVVQATLSKLPHGDFDFTVVKDDISVVEERAWSIMAQELICIRAWYDAISVLKTGLKEFLSSFTLRLLLVKVKFNFEQPKKGFEAHDEDNEAWPSGPHRIPLDRSQTVDQKYQCDQEAKSQV